MSISSPFARNRQLAPTIPKGDVLGSFETYLEAQSIVDRLSKAEFPVAKVSIVGSGLKTVERVTGKLSNARAAAGGAASGAWFGLFIGLLTTLFSTTDAPLPYIGAAVLIGAGFGVIFGLVSYQANRRRHDYTSVNQVLATQYDVIVDPALSMRAQELLARPVAQ